MNQSVHYADSEGDPSRFDLIFVNEVFEHVADPVATLRLLSQELSPSGKIFIDMPRRFWLDPLPRRVVPGSPSRPLPGGTVSTSPFQSWSQRGFESVVAKAGLRTRKSARVSEFTMQPDFYLDWMEIPNPALRLAGHAFWRLARYGVKK